MRDIAYPSWPLLPCCCGWYVSLLSPLCHFRLSLSLSLNLYIRFSHFMPNTGSAAGRIFGQVMLLIFPDGIFGVQILPHGYAIVGAAAFTAGFTQTVSAAIIMMELAQSVTHLFPVFVSTVCVCVCARGECASKRRKVLER